MRVWEWGVEDMKECGLVLGILDADNGLQRVMESFTSDVY